MRAFYKRIAAKIKQGTPLENWVFVSLFTLAGFLVIACGLKQEINFTFIAVGLVTSSLSSLILVEKFKKWIQKL